MNYEGIVDDIIKEAQEITVNTANALQTQYKVIVVEPLHQVDTAAQNIENRREEDVSCVEAKDPEVEEIVNTLHDEMIVCGSIAAQTSVEIMNDVNSATQQLVFDGYDVLKLYKKCKNYKNSVLRSSCYAKLSIKATLYIRNSRRSIKTIKEANKRVPDVFVDADACTHKSADKAIVELNVVQSEVDACIKANI